jgi:hypothetical protein
MELPTPRKGPSFSESDGQLRPERRKDRSEDTLLALTRLLDATRAAENLAALTVADGSGCLVAGSGAARLCDELCAFAPLLLHPPSNDTVPTRLDVVSRKTLVRRLSIDGLEVLICGQGDDPRAALARASEGCARILGARRRY